MSHSYVYPFSIIDTFFFATQIVACESQCIGTGGVGHLHIGTSPVGFLATHPHALIDQELWTLHP